VIEADRVVPVPAAGVSREGIVPQLAPTLAPTRAPVEIDNVFEKLSGWRDSNPRPPAPNQLYPVA